MHEIVVPGTGPMTLSFAKARGVHSDDFWSSVEIFRGGSCNEILPGNGGMCDMSGKVSRGQLVSDPCGSSSGHETELRGQASMHRLRIGALDGDYDLFVARWELEPEIQDIHLSIQRASEDTGTILNCRLISGSDAGDQIVEHVQTGDELSIIVRGDYWQTTTTGPYSFGVVLRPATNP